MDQSARSVLITILERLRGMEKTRLEDEATLYGFLNAIAPHFDPKVKDEFKKEKAKYLDRLKKDPGRDLDPIYAGLIKLLKNLDPTVKDEQEKLRQILESFEGPPQ